MTWVRYDDNVRNHPKVEPLDDATYRLWREALEWCAQNLTDGSILTRQLGLTSTRATPARARKLVDAGLWHKAGTKCDSEYCPPSPVDGWVLHDYWDYQPTAEKVRVEQEANRKRQRRWKEARKGNKPDNASGNSVTNGGENGVINGYPAPPRPAPKGRGGAKRPQRQAAADGGETAASGGVEDPSPAGVCPEPGHWPELAANCRLCASERKARADA